MVKIFCEEGGEYQQIINISSHKCGTIHWVNGFHNLLHQSLKHTWSVHQSKRHNSKLKQSLRGSKSSLLLWSWVHLNLPRISREENVSHVNVASVCCCNVFVVDLYKSIVNKSFVNVYSDLPSWCKRSSILCSGKVSAFVTPFNLKVQICYLVWC